MAIRLRDIEYQTQFYWKGDRYKQVIRPKTKKKVFSVTCRRARDPMAPWVQMPSGRVVKPVVRLGDNG
jgi:hypothetical protein